MFPFPGLKSWPYVGAYFWQTACVWQFWQFGWRPDTYGPRSSSAGAPRTLECFWLVHSPGAFWKYGWGQGLCPRGILVWCWIGALLVERSSLCRVHSLCIQVGLSLWAHCWGSWVQGLCITGTSCVSARLQTCVWGSWWHRLYRKDIFGW